MILKGLQTLDGVALFKNYNISLPCTRHKPCATCTLSNMFLLLWIARIVHCNDPLHFSLKLLFLMYSCILLKSIHGYNYTWSSFCLKSKYMHNMLTSLLSHNHNWLKNSTFVVFSVYICYMGDSALYCKKKLVINFFLGSYYRFVSSCMLPTCKVWSACVNCIYICLILQCAFCIILKCIRHVPFKNFNWSSRAHHFL